jgi:CBS domain-containing protein
MYRFIECTAGQYMTREVITVSRNMSLSELEALFEKYDFNAFPVIEGEEIIGIVTKFDFLRAFAFTTGQMLPRYKELMQRSVADTMTEAVVHVEASTSLTRVLQLMVQMKARSLPVVVDRRLVGVISREDIIRALREATRA